VFFPTISLNVGLYTYTIRYGADIKNIRFSSKHRKKSKKLPCSRIKKIYFCLCAYDQILKVFYAYFTTKKYPSLSYFKKNTKIDIITSL
jgi:hypothetical protein